MKAAEPASSSVPFFGPLTADSAAQVWRHLLDSVTDMVSVQADKCDRVAIGGPHRLAVWFRAKYNSCKQFCELPDQKAKLEQGLAAATGEHVRIDFALVDDEAEEGPAPRTTPAVARRQQQADVLRRPLVKRAMELFGVEQPRVELPEN